MSNGNGLSLLVIVVIVLIVLFVLWNCKITCSGFREGYTKSCFNTTCGSFRRSPVDYIYKQPGDWTRNPHHQADPGNYYQPVHLAPVDNYPEQRRQDAGELFMQYQNDWQGCGFQSKYLPNDEKTRFDLAEAGRFDARRVLANMRHPRHQSLEY